MPDFASSALNFAWAGVSLAAFAWFVVSARLRRESSLRVVTCRAMALALALISLFPCVSASDDVARLELLGTQANCSSDDQWAASERGTFGGETLATLVGLLEVLEASQLPAATVWLIALCVIAFALALDSSSVNRLLPSYAGRAPPAAAL